MSFIPAKAIKPEPILPKNYLNYKQDNQGLDFKKESLAFLDALDNASNEGDIQRYIKNNKKLFIPYSLLNGYPFYHHGGAYLFIEQQLGSEYQVDYCLLSNNSDGYHLLFIELEDPSTEFVLSNTNGETEAVRKGLIQINDWKSWIDNNRAYFLKNIGLTYKGIDIPITQINYLLVVSRRKYMDKRATELRSRKKYEANNLNIITYDRLVDNIAEI